MPNSYSGAARKLTVGTGRTSGSAGRPPVGPPMEVTQRFDDGSGARRRIDPAPATVSPGAPFTLIDARPSFERTPVDNVWRGGND